MAYHPDLTNLLADGFSATDELGTFVIESHPLGPVLLPTGKVVGCDPLVFSDSQPPFLVEVDPGTYPLVAWVAAVHSGPDDEKERFRRTAALQLVIRDEPIVRWDLALVDGQDRSALDVGEYFGYPVDAGTGTLADLVAVRALAAWDFDRVQDVFIPAQLPAPPTAIGAVTDEATGANVISVSSGFGDGSYPTFVGYTGAGEVAAFVTDFMVMPDEDPE